MYAEIDKRQSQLEKDTKGDMQQMSSRIDFLEDLIEKLISTLKEHNIEIKSLHLP